MPLSAIMIDLDHFKEINDTYGHAIGDAVIRTLSDIMKKHTAGRGYAGRWGGDEFLIILPGTTLETAETLSIRMKNDLSMPISSLTIFPSAPASVSPSPAKASSSRASTKGSITRSIPLRKTERTASPSSMPMERQRLWRCKRLMTCDL